MTSSRAASLSPEYPILGLLLLEPSHGYKLHRSLQAQLGEIWYISQSQLYSILNRLEEDGLVRGTAQPQEGRPDRYVLQPTSEGRAHFERWLREPTSSSARALRVEFLTRLFFCRRLGRWSPSELIRRQEDNLRIDLQALEHHLDELAGRGAINRLSLELRIHQLESFLSWLSQCREALQPQTRTAPG